MVALGLAGICGLVVRTYSKSNKTTANWIGSGQSLTHREEKEASGSFILTVLPFGFLDGIVVIAVSPAP